MSIDSDAPRILVFDSGLGGLTVFAPISAARPDAELTYVADDAFFPYGELSEAALVERVVSLMGELVAAHAPDLVVVACNTASTLVLGPLRARFPDLAFVGTVPAIKPAALASRSRLVSVLATPGTVARDYTRGLIREFAGDCEVTLVGSRRLAGLAERALRCETVTDAEIAAEIAPGYVERDGRRTDEIVLACTHFPLLAERIRAVAPWPAELVDPGPAIARRVDALAGPVGSRRRAGLSQAIFTSGAPAFAPLQKALRERGLTISSAT
ncbi:MAG TPA: glutamate racemase [Roseiarcus sp.]|nr:glutamate racemase [Roseiarcus sp.]